MILTLTHGDALNVFVYQWPESGLGGASSCHILLSGGQSDWQGDCPKNTRVKICLGRGDSESPDIRAGKAPGNLSGESRGAEGSRGPTRGAQTARKDPEDVLG